MVIPFSSGVWPIMMQVTGTVMSLLLLALAPPAHGTILLVSLAGAPLADIANAAMATGARIARRGPGAHSLVVFGDRARLIHLSRQGLIPLAAPNILCGE